MLETINLHDLLLVGTLEVMRMLALALVLTRHGGRAEHVLRQRSRQVHLCLQLGRLRANILLALRHDADFLPPVERGSLLLSLCLLHELSASYGTHRGCRRTTHVVVGAQLAREGQLLVTLDASLRFHIEVERLLDFVGG